MIGNVLGRVAEGLAVGTAVGVGAAATAAAINTADRVTLGCAGYPGGPVYGPCPQWMPAPGPVCYPQPGYPQPGPVCYPQPYPQPVFVPQPVLFPRPVIIGGGWGHPGWGHGGGWGHRH
jgi:hypothetical protein